jgi:hypothetical protein
MPYLETEVLKSGHHLLFEGRPVLFFRVTGLRNGDYSNYNRAGGYAELNTLKDNVARKKFARLCVTNVGQTMKRELGGNRTDKQGHLGTITVLVKNLPMKIDISTMENLFLNFLDFFSDGLEQGAAKLKRYLVDKTVQYRVQGRPLPEGIIDRMAYLGWAPGPARPNSNAPLLTPTEMQGRYHRPRNAGRNDGVDAT